MRGYKRASYLERSIVKRSLLHSLHPLCPSIFMTTSLRMVSSKYSDDSVTTVEDPSLYTDKVAADCVVEQLSTELGFTDPSTFASSHVSKDRPPTGKKRLRFAIDEDLDDESLLKV